MFINSAALTECQREHIPPARGRKKKKEKVVSGNTHHYQLCNNIWLVLAFNSGLQYSIIVKVLVNMSSVSNKCWPGSGTMADLNSQHPFKLNWCLIFPSKIAVLTYFYFFFSLLFPSVRISFSRGRHTPPLRLTPLSFADFLKSL